MGNSILYNVLNKLNDNDRKIAEAMLAKLNIFLNGDSALSAGKFEWKQDYQTVGSLEQIKDRVYDLNDILNTNLEYETYLIIMNRMKAICEGTDAEAEMNGVERSFLSYYGEANNLSVTEVKPSICTNLHIMFMRK